MKNNLKIFSFFTLFLLIVGGLAFAASMYQRCEPGVNCEIGEYVYQNDGHTPITTDNYCKLTVKDPVDSVILNSQNMSDKNDGWYYYTINQTTPQGTYRSTMCCNVGGAEERCLDKTFILGQSFDSISSTTETTKTNVDFIRRATFDFSGSAASGTTTTLVDSTMDQSDDYWNNYELVMISGTNSGQKKVVCDFSQSTHTLTVCEAFSGAISLGDKYIISHDRKLVNSIWTWSDRTLTSFGALAADVWNNAYAPQRRLTDKVLSGGGNLGTESYIASAISPVATESSLETYIASAVAPLATQAGVESKITSATTGLATKTGTEAYITSAVAPLATLNSLSSLATQASVNAIRTSQQKQWTVYTSHNDSILAGNTYRFKAWVLDYESVPTDANSLPQVTIYDSLRNKVVENVAMTKLSTGVYEYTYSVASSASQGLWETETSITVEPGKIIKRSDYWSVAGSPAQVRILSMADSGVPSISANIVITNEGLAGYEYHYEWCVVANQDNACGGGDDTFYGSASKYINVGTDWNTALNATVNQAGNYWFKIVVYYGTEASGASQSFTAVIPQPTAPTQTVTASSGGGGGTVAAPVAETVTTTDNEPTISLNFLWQQIQNLIAIITGQNKRISSLESGTMVLQNSISRLENRLAALSAIPSATVQSAPAKVQVNPTNGKTNQSSTVPENTKAKIRLQF